MPPSETSNRFDRRTVSRCWEVARLMFVSEARLKAIGLVALVRLLGGVRRAILHAELQRLGIRNLTTGPRSQLDRFHTLVLTLEGGGGWSVQDLPRLARSA